MFHDINTEFTYEIPLVNGNTKTITLTSGSSAVFVGANGSGKSRLGSLFDLHDNYRAVTLRISAQRALDVPENISMREPEEARKRLLFGPEEQPHLKLRDRWQLKPTSRLINDFSQLLTAVFSDDYACLAAYREKYAADPSVQLPVTKLATVIAVWEKMIVTRGLRVRGPSLYAYKPHTNEEYPAVEISDGERVILYLVGECLLAPEHGVIIVDEPELHIHKAILSKLWDQIEAERKDCVFIYITHDLEFAKTRTAGERFAVRSFSGYAWDIVDIPNDEDLPEEITTRILGSRRPILFVEGEGTSRDINIYGKAYPDFTIIPVGSCEHVIHMTISYNSRKSLHHLSCFGLIDRDGCTDEEVAYLKYRDIHVMEFAEIENVLLAEKVLREASKLMAFDEEIAEKQLEQVKDQLLGLLTDKEIEKACVRFVKRRIASTIERIDFESKAIDDLKEEFSRKVSIIDPEAMFEGRHREMKNCQQDKDYRKLLRIYDNKGMVMQIGRIFGLQANQYPEAVLRHMGSQGGINLVAAVRSALPSGLFCIGDTP